MITKFQKTIIPFILIIFSFYINSTLTSHDTHAASFSYQGVTYSNPDWPSTYQSYFESCIKGAIDNGGGSSAAVVCTETCTPSTDGQLGVMWAKGLGENGRIEADGKSDSHGQSLVSAKLYGAVYSCQRSGGDTDMKARYIAAINQATRGTRNSYSNDNAYKNAVIGFKLSYVKNPADIKSCNGSWDCYKSTELNRGYRPSNIHTWNFASKSGKTSGGASSLSFKIDTLGFFSDETLPLGYNSSTGEYYKKIYFFRCPSDNFERSSCFSDAPSRLSVYKIATFSHSNSASYNGATYSNDDIITIPKETESATINFTHILRRSDGWTSTSAKTNYALAKNATNLPNETTSFTDTFSISDSKNTGTIAQNGEARVCSYVTYKNITGLDGYNRPRADGDTSSSEICVKVRRAGESNLTVSGSSKVTDSSNPSNSGTNLTFNLPPSETSKTVKFEHTISRGDTFSINTPVTHSIEESLNDVIQEWKVGTGWPTGSISETLSQSLKSKTYSYNKTISVNQGESKKVCQTLHWTPTQFTFDIDGSGNPTGTPTGNETPSSTTACVTVSRAELTGRSPKEHSNVTINSVNANNDWDSHVGTAPLTSANLNQDYNVSFTHFLQLDEPFDEANVSYTIYEGKDKAHGTAKATGNVTLSSENKYALTSDINVLTATLKVTDWGQTNQVCQWVEYTPTTFAFIDGTYSAENSTGTRTTYEVCGSVTSPNTEEASISATTTGNVSAATLPARDMSVRGIFHFNHTLTHGQEVNIPLPTTYSVYYKIITKTRTSEGCAMTGSTVSGCTVIESVEEYQPRSGKHQIPLDDPGVKYSEPTNIIDQFNYEIQGNQSVTVCEYISLNYSRFKITNSDPRSIVERSNPLDTDEVCLTITRPGLIQTEGDPVTISGESFFDPSDYSNLYCDKLLPTKENTSCKIGKSNNPKINFSHRLIRNNIPNSEYIENTYYLFEDNNTVAHSALESNFYSQTIGLGNNETKILPEASSLDVGNNNIISTSSIQAGETKSACRTVYYKYNKYSIRYDYYYDWDGHRLDIAGTPFVTQTPDTSTDGIGNSNLVCANITRPYNFRIDYDGLSRDGVTENDITYPGEEIANINYKIKVQKRDSSAYWDNFAITEIPNAEIRLLGLTINDDSSYIDTTSSLAADPCDYYRSALGSANLLGCDTLRDIERTDDYTIRKDGTSTSYYLSDSSYTHTYSAGSITVPNDLPVGTKYCTALAVSPINSGNGNSISEFDYSQWVVSNISCSTVGKKPTIQVLGSSVYSSGSINTSKSTKVDGSNKTYFGSWTDFALISKADILGGSDKGMASGASLSGGRLNAPQICNHSPLTIANSQCDDSTAEILGQATGATRSSDAQSFYETLASKYVTNTPENYDGNLHTFCYDDNTLVYFSSGSLTINSDINLVDGGCPHISDGSYQYLSDIPQIIILAGNKITIAENVKNIDAWIVTKGILNTCDGHQPSDSYLTYDTCNKQLAINGPVIANEIELPRTYGGNAVDGDTFTDGTLDGNLSKAAEIIDYIPTTFLWGYNQSKKDAQPKTVYLKQLAPRW